MRFTDQDYSCVVFGEERGNVFYFGFFLGQDAWTVPKNYSDSCLSLGLVWNISDGTTSNHESAVCCVIRFAVEQWILKRIQIVGFFPKAASSIKLNWSFVWLYSKRFLFVVFFKFVTFVLNYFLEGSRVQSNGNVLFVLAKGPRVIDVTCSTSYIFKDILCSLFVRAMLNR